MKVSRITNLLGPLDGSAIPGGCDECNAVQRIRMESALVFVVDVFHDDDCPRLNGRASR